MLSHLDIFPARISVPYAVSNLHVGRLLLLDKVEGTPVIPNSTHIMLKKYNGHLGNSSDGRYLFLEKYQYFFNRQNLSVRFECVAHAHWPTVLSEHLLLEKNTGDGQKSGNHHKIFAKFFPKLAFLYIYPAGYPVSDYMV